MLLSSFWLHVQRNSSLALTRALERRLSRLRVVKSLSQNNERCKGSNEGDDADPHPTPGTCAYKRPHQGTRQWIVMYTCMRDGRGKKKEDQRIHACSAGITFNGNQCFRHGGGGPYFCYHDHLTHLLLWRLAPKVQTRYDILTALVFVSVKDLVSEVSKRYWDLIGNSKISPLSSMHATCEHFSL